MLDKWFFNGIKLNEKISETTTKVNQSTSQILETDQKVGQAYLAYVTKQGFFSQEEIRSYLEVSQSAVSS